MKQILFIIMIAVAASCSSDVDADTLQEGDIVFIESQSLR